MNKNRAPSQISTVLSGVLEQLGLSRILEEKKVREHWPGIVGSRIAEIAEVDSLKEGRLYLRVVNPVWRMELNFQKDEIAIRVNKLLEGESVKEVVFI